jgi:hypothetical protein
VAAADHPEAQALMAARQNRKASGAGRNRSDKPRDYWKKDAPPIELDRFVFRGTLRRGDQPKRERVLDIGPLLTSLSWEDTGPLMNGTAEMMQLDTERFSIKTGHQLKIEWAKHRGADWAVLWQMRVQTVDETSDGTVSLELIDELSWLDKSRDDFQYKKGKGKSKHSRRKGWLAHVIARDICRRYGVKVGKLAKGKHRIENLTEENISPVAAITKAYDLDRAETGRKFIVRMRYGKLEVLTLKRSRYLLLVGPHLIEAAYSRGIKEDLTTRFRVSTEVKRGHRKQKKIEVLVRSKRKVMRRFGLIHKPLTLDDPVKTKAQARNRAKRKLGQSQKPVRELSVSMPGVPSVGQGQAIRVKLEDMGLNELVYVTSASHMVSAGEYTMDLEVSFTDPFTDPEGEKIRKEICKKAVERHRKPPRFCNKGFDFYAPTSAAARGDAGAKRRSQRR